MSASLKERLKRSRPRFVSPLLSTAKKPRISAPTIGVVGKLDFSEGETKTAEQLTPSSHQQSNSVTEEGGEQLRMLVSEKTALQRELEEAQERLRKLRMVKIYRSKVRHSRIIPE